MNHCTSILHQKEAIVTIQNICSAEPELGGKYDSRFYKLICKCTQCQLLFVFDYYPSLSSYEQTPLLQCGNKIKICVQFFDQLYYNSTYPANCIHESEHHDAHYQLCGKLLDCRNGIWNFSCQGPCFSVANVVSHNNNNNNNNNTCMSKDVANQLDITTETIAGLFSQHALLTLYFL